MAISPQGERGLPFPGSDIQPDEMVHACPQAVYLISNGHHGIIDRRTLKLSKMA
jgi:hypothetical protein